MQGGEGAGRGANIIYNISTGVPTQEGLYIQAETLSNTELEKKKEKLHLLGAVRKKIAVNKEKNKYKQIQRGRKEKDSEMLEMGGEASSSSSKQSCERSNPSY